jgi:methylase of polypeptide subunit release factors
MPNKYTFQIPEIQHFVRHWIGGMTCIVDPFAGKSALATRSNDIADSGVDAEIFCQRLLDEGVVADAIIFDPPYSPRQISESYKNAGLKVDSKTTQNAALYSRVLKPLLSLLRPGGIALRFGWQSAGVRRSWELMDLLIVQHGSGHNDTICTAQRKPLTPEV